MSPDEAAVFRRALIEWYERAGRDLPWRAGRDPYAILVSELMAQQTRAEVAARHFVPFMARFPGAAELAAAAPAEVLAAWAGLGYYRRARQLQAAARRIMERHGGAFPDRPEELAELPGVGPYTAAAVASIAFDRPLAAVDGNVARVIARLAAIESDVRAGEGAAAVRALAGQLLDPERPGDFNQAMMELGALVCRPRRPDCPVCPVVGFCRGRASGIAADLPRRPPAEAPVELHRAALALTRPGPEPAVWLEAIPDGEWNAGLLDLPGRPLAGHEEPAAAAAELARARGIAAVPQAAGRFSHTITRHRIRVELYQVPLAPGESPGGAGRFLRPSEAAAGGLCARARRALALLSEPVLD